jgi:choline monooxygenase
MPTGILQKLLSGFDPDLPLDRARTIPNTWYTSSEVYEAERRAVFGRTWQFVGRAEQVARPGSFVTAEIAG